MSVYDLLNIFVVGGKWFLQYGDSWRSSLVKKVSGGQEQEQVFVAMEFTVQISTFC